MDKVIIGKAWVGGNDVLALDIITKEKYNEMRTSRNIDDFGPWCMEGACEDFKGKENAFKDTGCTIVVAGNNFGGGGKSIEHPILALLGAGVKVVLAESFARFNFRNSINNGLLVLECKGLYKETETGDELTVDLEKSTVTNSRTGIVREVTKLPPFVFDICEAGGLINSAKKQLGVE